MNERDETCLNNAIHELNLGYLQHMPGTATNGGMSSLRVFAI